MLQINFISKNFLIECMDLYNEDQDENLKDQDENLEYQVEVNIDQNIEQETGLFKVENLQELMIPDGENQRCNSIIQSEKQENELYFKTNSYCRWIVETNQKYIWYRLDALFFNNSTKVEVFQLDVGNIPLYLYELTLKDDTVINIFINQFGKQIFSYKSDLNGLNKQICYFKKKITQNTKRIDNNKIFDCYELITTSETDNFNPAEDETFGYFGFGQTDNKDGVYHQFYTETKENLARQYKKYSSLLIQKIYFKFKKLSPEELINPEFQYNPETYHQESEEELIRELSKLNKKKERRKSVIQISKELDYNEIKKYKKIKKSKNIESKEEEIKDTSSKDEGNKTGNRILLAIGISALLLGCFIAYKQLSKKQQNQENFDNPSQID